ncbi:MAG: SDR family NAD(P)-dependent oxidoreductase [bacterium]|nr:SDR family NAD(P)-dependent oxidoreductase [bacterium]
MKPHTALVTGAASGIGAEVARRLVRRGHRVIVVDRTDELAARAAADIGAGSLAVGCDLATEAGTAGLCERIADDWRDLEVLVCNAGAVVLREVADQSAGDLDRQLDVMLRSPMQVIRAAIPVFTERERGHIMATVSLSGICPMPTTAAYSAAKAGLRAFLAALNVELTGTGVHISGIYPTAIDTPMLRQAVSGDGSLEYLNRVRTVDDVADAYERALDRPRLEIYVPYRDGFTARAVQWTPGMIPRTLPLFRLMSRRNRREYLRRITE